MLTCYASQRSAAAFLTPARYSTPDSLRNKACLGSRKHTFSELCAAPANRRTGYCRVPRGAACPLCPAPRWHWHWHAAPLHPRYCFAATGRQEPNMLKKKASPAPPFTDRPPWLPTRTTCSTLADLLLRVLTLLLPCLALSPRPHRAVRATSEAGKVRKLVDYRPWTYHQRLIRTRRTERLALPRTMAVTRRIGLCRLRYLRRDPRARSLARKISSYRPRLLGVGRSYR